MNKSFLMGSVAGGILVTAGGAAAGYRAWSTAHEVPVVAVKALHKTVSTPRQECHDEQVTKVKDPRDPNKLAGTGIGAVVGGLIGNQIGGGNGRALATIAGAAAGGYAGHTIEGKMQKGNTYTTTENRCVTVYDKSEEPAGYDVAYVLDGKTRHVHMDRDPGKHLPLKDGRVVTS